MCSTISIVISVVLIILFSLILIFTVKISRTVSIASKNFTTMRDFTYPVARRDGSVVDDFHGTKVKTVTVVLSRLKCVDNFLRSKYVAKKNVLSCGLIQS